MRLINGFPVLAGSVAALLCTSVLAQQAKHIATPANSSDYVYSGPISTVPSPTGYQKSLSGPVQVAIKLSDPPLVVAVGANARNTGIAMSAAQQRAYLAQLQVKQNAVASQVTALGGTILGRVTKGHNAVMATVDASRLQALKGISGVVAVRPLHDLPYSLAVTLPYIGATAVQKAGITGAGIRIAMLDTGIDYTHYNLGGSGLVSDYALAKAAATGTPPPSLFPTAKVIGGFDFTGEVWPNGPLMPDPNPIDIAGHGSRTADIAGGRSNDGLHVGTAPGSKLYAVKICSSVSSSCSGVAILEGIDFALDPDNTGTLNNAVDIISMSVGGAFGQREADDAEAFTDVVNFGVVSVVAAGNDGDVPYIVGGPGSTPEVIGVAATTAVNSSVIPLVINSPASIRGTYANTATLDFAPVTGSLTGNVVYVGRGCPGDTLLASPAGQIALIDRGACAVSLKVDNAANAGAIGVLIGLVAPGDAVQFSNGGGSHFVPSLVITQSTANLIKSALAKGTAVSVTLDPANAISTAGEVASYSSRGPNFSYNALKPDIAAPGTIVAADVGTGKGQSPESGTSFATPLTAGSAALMLSKNHSLSPVDIKSLLMGAAETNVFNNIATQPGYLAPISRVGAGELRIDRSIAASTGVWDASNPLGVSLSFGTYRLNAPATYKKKVIVRNYSSTARTYSITNAYRDAPNNTGATIAVPSTIFVPANGSANFTMSLTVTPAFLPIWTLNGGSRGASGELLNTVEYAGYLTFTSGTESVHIPWHILPHKAANVTPSSTSVALNGQPAPLTLFNANSSLDGAVDIFSLTGVGTQFPASVLPAPGSDFEVINLRAVGIRPVCADAMCATFAVQFAINTFGQRSHPDVPAEFDVHLDVNNDGVDDLVIFNADIGFLTTGTTFSGQNGIFIVDIAAGTASGPFAYAQADLDSANIIFTVPLSALKTASGLQLGISSAFNFSVLAFDNAFTGNLTDFIANMPYELDMPQFYPAPPFTLVPANSSTVIGVFPNNAATPFFSAPYNGNSPSQQGLLLMYQDAKAGQEADIVKVTP